MKKLVLKLSAVLFLFSAGSALADSVIVTQTSSWPSVPITVDTASHTYTVTGTVPTGSANYYYSYPGYRCFVQKRDVVGVDVLMFKAGVSGGQDIYCYAE